MRLHTANRRRKHRYHREWPEFRHGARRLRATFSERDFAALDWWQRNNVMANLYV